MDEFEQQDYERQLQSQQEQMVMQQGGSMLPRSDTRPISDIMSKHLDAKQILVEFENLLSGNRLNANNGKWEPITQQIYNDKGKLITILQGPLMEQEKVSVLIGYLRMYLNPNTFLSRLDDENINDIMWDVSKNLAILFYRLRGKIVPENRALLWSTVEHAIYFGLKRAISKMTLDALSKNVHSFEHITQGNVGMPTKDKKGEFKVFGW